MAMNAGNPAFCRTVVNQRKKNNDFHKIGARSRPRIKRRITGVGMISRRRLEAGLGLDLG
jgi:hypothetical protein